MLHVSKIISSKRNYTCVSSSVLHSMHSTFQFTQRMECTYTRYCTVCNATCTVLTLQIDCSVCSVTENPLFSFPPRNQISTLVLFAKAHHQQSKEEKCRVKGTPSIGQHTMYMILEHRSICSQCDCLLIPLHCLSLQPVVDMLEEGGVSGESSLYDPACIVFVST